MTPSEMKLAAYFLDLAASEYSNHGCNDMDKEASVAAGWDEAEQRNFTRALKKWNGDMDDTRTFKGLCDFEVMMFLAERLRES